MMTARPGPGGRPAGWQQAHARRYLETGGQDGHIWEGVPKVPGKDRVLVSEAALRRTVTQILRALLRRRPA